MAEEQSVSIHGQLSTKQLQELTDMNVNQVRSRIRNLIDAGEVLATAMVHLGTYPKCTINA